MQRRSPSPAPRTKITASIATIPSSRSCQERTVTAAACGISCRVRCRIFSRTHSAASARSGWSVRKSSGNSEGPSGSASKIRSSSASHPSPVRAETGTASLSPHVSTAVLIRGRSAVFGRTVSILFRTARAGIPAPATMRAASASPGPAPRPASTTRSARSTPVSASRAASTIARFMRSFGRWKPGVSTKTTWPRPGIVRTPVIRKRVVWGTSATAASFSPTRRLSRVDFPTFVQPAIATWPARGALTGPAPPACRRRASPAPGTPAGDRRRRSPRPDRAPRTSRLAPGHDRAPP